MNRQIQVVVVLGLLMAAQGQAPLRPEVPESLKAPTGEEVVLAAHATGTQIYVCQQGSDQKYGWVFKAPEAELTDTSGKKIIHHSAGPTWKHVDESEVKAKVVAKQDAPKVEAPNPQAIPWLLLSATSHSGEGILSRVTSIQRIHTEGGVAPEAKYCEGSSSGREVGVVYAADYYFYGPKP
jgi:uncharacterized protein DUF3455